MGFVGYWQLVEFVLAPGLRVPKVEVICCVNVVLNIEAIPSLFFMRLSSSGTIPICPASWMVPSKISVAVIQTLT